MKKLLLTCSLLGLFTTFNAQETETDPAPVDTIEEDFSSFNAAPAFGAITLPQKGWKASVLPYGASVTRVNTDGSNKFISTYPNTNSNPQAVYIISPELTSIDGLKTLSFKMFGTATVQVGVSASNDIETIAQNFKRKSAETTVVTGDWNEFNNWKISKIQSDSTEYKYIVFKITPTLGHSTVRLDDVYYKNENLSVSDFGKKEAPKFAVDNNNLVFSDENVSNVKIFSANGSLVSTEKISNKRANISKLSTGVYFLIIEDNNGNITKSKFIKK